MLVPRVAGVGRVQGGAPAAAGQRVVLDDSESEPRREVVEVDSGRVSGGGGRRAPAGGDPSGGEDVERDGRVELGSGGGAEEGAEGGVAGEGDADRG